MIKILHTADWHIGQMFHGYNRRSEHKHFFQWLLLKLKEEEIDIMLVAGDIFDISNPSGDAQKLYYNFLVQIHIELPELQIIIIAGNHDSSSKLEAPKELLNTFNTTVIGYVKKVSVQTLSIRKDLNSYKKNNTVDNKTSSSNQNDTSVCSQTDELDFYPKDELAFNQTKELDFNETDNSVSIKTKNSISSSKNREIELDEMIIPIHIANGEDCICLALPYIRHGDYPYGLSYTEGIKELYRRLILKAQELYPSISNIIAMGHFYAAGSEIAKEGHSERLSIGGLDCVNLSDFSSTRNLKYMALGHIHKAQRIAQNDNIRYSGSALSMSFSEIHYKHGVNIVSIENGISHTERLIYEPLVKLIAIPKEYKPIEDVLKEIQKLPEAMTMDNSNNNTDKINNIYSENNDPFLEVRVLTDGPQLDLSQKIREALETKAVRLCSIKSMNKYSNNTEFKSDITLKDLQNPQYIANEYWKQKHDNNDMPEDLMEMFLKVSNDVITNKI